MNNLELIAEAVDDAFREWCMHKTRFFSVKCKSPLRSVVNFKFCGNVDTDQQDGFYINLENGEKFKVLITKIK